MRGVTMRVEQTRAAMIESNLGLVHVMAEAYRGRGVANDDLVQEGTVGLIQAGDRFDPDRGGKFATHAAWWIRRALIDALGQSRVIRMPAKAQRSLSAVRGAETELCGPTSGSARHRAVAEPPGLSAERVRSLRTAARVTASLDEPVGDNGAPRAELVAAPDPVAPWRHPDDRETRRRARSLLKVLPGRPREVLVRRYGVAGGEAQT